jgi:hypothetical protein
MFLILIAMHTIARSTVSPLSAVTAAKQGCSCTKLVVAPGLAIGTAVLEQAAYGMLLEACADLAAVSALLLWPPPSALRHPTATSQTA